VTITPNIDTKALRELRDDACKLDGHSLMEVLHAQQKYERAIINAAPALLDLADRAQEQAKECASNLRSLRASQEECYSLYEERDALKAERRTFPLQPDRKAKPGPVNIPWSVAEKAYGVYALRFGKDQSIERLAERQGFSWSEMDMFLPGWREECSEIDALRAKLSASEREVERLTAEREDQLKSRDRVIVERNEQSGLRDKLIERMTASDETWSEALGNERKLRDASEREAERLREALTTIDEAFAEGGFFDDGFARSTIRAALRGEEAPRE
jgi:hypothetical protein